MDRNLKSILKKPIAISDGNYFLIMFFLLMMFFYIFSPIGVLLSLSIITIGLIMSAYIRIKINKKHFDRVY